MNTPYRRDLQRIIEESLYPNKVNLIFGTRRVGKTFLLQQIKANTAYKTLVLEGEDADTQRLLAIRSIANYRRLLDRIDLLIIDEAQAIPEIGKVLKLIVDHTDGLRIIVTGSSAFDLANLSGEPLTGRAFHHQLYSLSQTELSQQENLLETRQRLEERLIYGTYPEAVRLATNAERERYLTELTGAYLLKDILTFDGIRSASKLVNLLRLIAFQVGKEVSMEELGKQLQLSKNTVEKYLDLLTKVFVLMRLGGFSRNLRKEVSKNSRWYFLDNGIRNALINDFRPIALRTDISELWENYLIAERIKKWQANHRRVEGYFWRTYDQQEIDWIEVENGQINAFEFKWRTDRAKLPKAFAETYPNAPFTIINQDNYLDFVQ